LSQNTDDFHFSFCQQSSSFSQLNTTATTMQQPQVHEHLSELEIVGLSESDNGRSCHRHAVCGESVRVGDVLRMKIAIVHFNGQLREAFKFVSVESATECCTVGYAPKFLVHRLMIEECHDKCVRVTKLYNDSENWMEARMSQTNRGMGLCVIIPFIHGIPSLE
jgi:hypothetical protein